MFNLPDTFREKNEDYIVVNAMKNFIKCRPSIKGRLGDNRAGLIKCITEYANESDATKEDTLNWLDSVVREGIKDLYIKKLTNESMEFVKDTKKVYEKVYDELRKVKVNHFCGNKYTENLSLVKFQVENKDTLVYTFYLCQLVYIYDGENDKKMRMLPICVDIYPNEGLIIGRGKPRQNMYKYDANGFDVQTSQKLNAEYKIFHSMQYIMELLGIQYNATSEIGWKLKNHLYRLLDKYTDTPKEIASLIEQSREEINSAIKIITDNVCTKGNRDDITSDIMNLIEKYFSITYEDKSIFTKGKDAYPLRIAATDEEESKVDQKSAREHPLQAKALFFDNKKMMQKNQICDGVVFKFRRKSKKYYEDEFKVKITVKNNCCHMKFFEYTEEVDIQNVLHLFIGA